MKQVFITGLLLWLNSFAVAQRTYVSKEQIAIITMDNHQSHVEIENRLLFFETNFNFESSIGKHFYLDITEEGKKSSSLLTLTKTGWNNKERVYAFSAQHAQMGSYTQFTVEPHSKFPLCIVLQTPIGKYMIFCNRL